MPDHDRLFSGRMNARFSEQARRRAAGYLPEAAKRMLQDAIQQATEMPDETEGILSEAMDANRLLRAMAAELTGQVEL